ncbi:MAG: hypothetical protein CMN55_10670 [Sneathiella sp.]|jgi:hypothetical protein|uniref:PAS domain-containing protein n=1 Tax=Sneathiella sp. TaxID=1964365 RepID=UPI000C586A0D|nr:PAS domain-containing protein [Sneathiella sp.]MAL79555.1 hypothetical protein [Sneathiella sp.]|tara:strand:+ start:279 stop:776 length:498 start_codon:yes stop_codon:yes gene_type:complete
MTEQVEEEARSDNFRKIIRLEVTSADDFRTQPVRRLYDWWAGYQPALPRRSDFDITEHWSIAPSLYLNEVAAPGHYQRRLNGEGVVTLIGVSLRGHDITRTSPLPELRRLAAYLDSVVESRHCRRCCGFAEVQGTTGQEFESVDCPLLDEAGDVRFILGAISLID